LFARLRMESPLLQIAAVLPALPYLALEFHYGNAQFFVFALAAAALLWLEKRPTLAAVALALGISIKIWPLFFVPYLLVLGYRRIAAWTLAIALGFTLIPAAFFGPLRYAQLLKEWGAQELGVAVTAGEPGIIGFPSQSLHSVMMRYFGAVDYSKLTDTNYPKFVLTTVDGQILESVWIVLAFAGYIALLLFARRRLQANELAVHGVAFCSMIVLQPFSQSADLVVLLWPIVVAAGLLHQGRGLPHWVRAALWTALSLMILKGLLPTAIAQRTQQVLGTDFLLTCLLAVGLIGACRRNVTSVADRRTGRSHGRDLYAHS
jgi:hypothetical protein